MRELLSAVKETAKTASTQLRTHAIVGVLKEAEGFALEYEAHRRRAGVADLFTYGYLSFAVRERRCYLLTGAPIYSPADGRRLAGKAASNKGEAKGLEHLHLVTFDLAERDGDGGRYRDHGPIFFRDGAGFPTYVNSLAISGEWLYASGRRGDGTTELFRVRDPTL